MHTFRMLVEKKFTCIRYPRPLLYSPHKKHIDTLHLRSESNHTSPMAACWAGPSIVHPQGHARIQKIIFPRGWGTFSFHVYEEVRGSSKFKKFEFFRGGGGRPPPPPRYPLDLRMWTESPCDIELKIFPFLKDIFLIKLIKVLNVSNNKSRGNYRTEGGGGRVGLVHLYL